MDFEFPHYIIIIIATLPFVGHGIENLLALIFSFHKYLTFELFSKSIFSSLSGVTKTPKYF